MKKDDSSNRPSLFDRLFTYLDKRQPSDRLLLYVFALLGIIALGHALIALNETHLNTIPERGGALKEGVIGSPRFVNPVLAITRTDNDLVNLIYSGLMTLNSEGNLENDLAESVTISEDGFTYNVILRKDIYFHDGQPVTTEDIAYTIGLIQDPELKSPLRGNWNGVNVEVINEHEINLVLESAYAPFMENLTIGILPKHVWGQLSIEELPFSQNNTEPVGSGPYRLANVHRNKSGLIDSYHLTAFKRAAEQPNISAIEIQFFQDDDQLLVALQNGTITSTASLPISKLDKVDISRYQIIENTLPRVFTVFINQNKSVVLRDPAVRKALDVMVDRQDLIDDILSGYGLPTDKPIPVGFLDVTSTSTVTSTGPADRLAEAEAILRAGQWTKTDSGRWQKDIDDNLVPLAFTLSTSNTDIFSATTDYLEDVWSQLGAEVTVQKFEQTDLIQAAIRPRDYQALLFGVEVGRSLDLYPFWHSSQREDPGLNISAYANITSDDLLSKVRVESDQDLIIEYMDELIAEIETDHPAIFLYSPSFAYVVDKRIMLSTAKRTAKPSERFSTIRDWYMNEDRVWSIFQN